MPRVLQKSLVRSRLPTSNVRLDQHETLEKIQQRAREGDTMSATELLVETKTPDDLLETVTAWEGDTMSAIDLLGETKTPDDQLETATT
jgi:hypothetical protein